MQERALSGSAGQRITKILEAATAAAEEHRRRISTATINMVVRDTVNWRQPPTLRGSNRKGRIYYATQVSGSGSPVCTCVSGRCCWCSTWGLSKVASLIGHLGVLCHPNNPWQSALHAILMRGSHD